MCKSCVLLGRLLQHRIFLGCPVWLEWFPIATQEWTVVSLFPCQLVARLVRPQFGQDVRFEAFLRLSEVRLVVFDKSAMLLRVVLALGRLMTQPYHFGLFVSFELVALLWPLKRFLFAALVEVRWVLVLRRLTFWLYAVPSLFAPL